MENDFILIITNKEDITSDMVVKQLHEKSIPFIRFNTEEFPLKDEAKLHISNSQNTITIKSPKWTIESNQVKSIWYRRPKVAEFIDTELSSEDRLFAYRETSSFLSNLWSMLSNCNWINDPYSLYKSERKSFQLKIASQVGFKIPDTLLTNSYADFIEFRSTFNDEVVVKPISHGAYGESEEFAIFTSDLSSERFFQNPETIQLCPFILQQKIIKKSDVRVTVFGTKIFAYTITPVDKDSNILDWRKYKPDELYYEKVLPPSKIVHSLRNFMNFFNLQFGAFDFCINNSDEWVFLEVNPNGQFGWLELATGDKLVDALINLFNNKSNED